MTMKMLDGRGHASRLRAVRMAALAIILISSQLHPTQAADGDLDKTFGNGGIVLTQFDTPAGSAGASSEGRTVAIQADGKIVTGGETSNGGSTDAALARYNPDGSLDPTFGAGGKVITPNTPGLDVLAIQADGKIVAGNEQGLLRYATDGSLEAGFGSGGMAATASTQVRKLALLPDGKIIAAGTESVNAGASSVFAVMRFNADGSPDTSFGVGGQATPDFRGHPAADLTSLAIQPDGRIIVGGTAFYGGPRSVFTVLARLNPDGTPDAAFGTSGSVVSTSVGVLFRALAVLDGGKIVGIGSSAGVFGAARYNSDGNEDTTFGFGGVRTAPFFAGADFAGSHLNTAAIGPDGKFLAAGDSGFGLALARYNSDGRTDTTFGAGGSVVTHLTDPQVHEPDTVRGIAFQADGQIVVTGVTGDSSDLVLARYNTEPDFVLAFADSTVNVSPGSKVKAILSIARRGGFTGNVTLTPPDTSALDIRISPNPVTTTDGSATFKIKVRGDTPPGSYPLTFTGQSDEGLAHSITLTLVVQ